MGYTTVTLNSVTLNITNCTPKSVPKKFKQVMGKYLSQVEIVGSNSTQWELQLTGVVTGATQSELNTNRSALEALDSTTSYAYVDGIHDGNYYVDPGSLQFMDSGTESHSSYKYTIRLLEV